MNRQTTGRWLSPLLILILSIGLTACQTGPPPTAETARAESADLHWVNQYVDGQGKTGIEGQVVLKETDAPLAGAFINIYPDTISNLLGPSQFISSPTDGEGRYRLEVPPVSITLSLGNG